MIPLLRRAASRSTIFGLAVALLAPVAITALPATAATATTTAAIPASSRTVTLDATRGSLTTTPAAFFTPPGGDGGAAVPGELVRPPITGTQPPTVDPIRGIRGPFTAPIEPHSRYEGQTTCSPWIKPGVRDFRSRVMRVFGGRDGGSVRACHIGGRSEHKEGRAWDWMMNAHDRRQAAAVDELLDYLLATDSDGNVHAAARRMGIMYIIWNRQIWSASRAHEGWRPYRGVHPHTDHVHFSFNRAGAAGTTSFWQRGRGLV